MDGNTWESLREQCLACQKCALASTRTQVVFGTGNPAAEVLFVGEGPGQQEDEQGLPFVGRSGKLLDVYLDAIGLGRDKNIYIANIVKCRPPGNRDPLPEEREACLPWLRKQFSHIRPKIIVCLGRIAAQVIIRPNYAIMKEHGQWEEKNGVWFTATLHPAALLRNPNNKPLAFEDFVAVREKIREVCDHTY
ncbi:uracil-DNA glycosylase [Ruminococcaceae bacterium OttesenSCG-928-O06]|nr:uracil-DNA glycosylase [Ruminococcaceae bacterium OttesenSCG-928-O06]